jgi:membrane protein required for colicin V production
MPPAFVLVFIASLFIGGLLAWLLKKLVEAVGLRPVDRALGGVFGLVRGHGGRAGAGGGGAPHQLEGQRLVEESVSGGVATAALRGLKPVVPEKFGAYLPA